MHVYSKNLSLQRMNSVLLAKYFTINMEAKQDECKVDPFTFQSLTLGFYTFLERIDFAKVVSRITLSL